MIKASFITTLIFACCAEAQVHYRIDTFAGQTPPNGVLATQSFLTSPQGIAIDASNNLYICEVNGAQIRRVALNSGIISIAAGTRVIGFSGDGGPATEAEFYAPRYVAVDGSGNIYITDQNNQRIRRIDTQGVISTVAGTGDAGYNGDNIPAIEAQLNFPRGIAVDSAGNLFIADQYNHRVRCVNAVSHVITTVVGTGNPGWNGDGQLGINANLRNPVSVIFDNGRNLLIADTGHSRVRLVDKNNQIITTVVGTGSSAFNGDNLLATDANINPRTIAVDAANNLYIADSANARVRRVDATTQVITTVAGNGVRGFGGDGGPGTSASLSSPEGVAVDGSYVYISDFSMNNIRRVALASGTITTYGGSFGPEGVAATSGFLNHPNYSVVDAAGNVYIADTFNNRIRRVDAVSQKITTVAGNGIPGYSGDGGSALSAQFYIPSGMTIDSAGNLYIADAGNNVIRKVESGTGIISTVAGNGTSGFNGDNIPATSAQMSYPMGVAVDGAGNLYIADNSNSRIRFVDMVSKTITTIAGTGDFGYNGDNIPATSAQLNGPADVSVDASGNLFIADGGNSRIRKVLAGNGNIVTIAGNGIPGYAGDGGPATMAELVQPAALSVNSSGALFIADQNVIRQVAVGKGIITTIAGNGIAGFDGDGGSATSAHLNGSFGIVPDTISARLYVTDCFNDRVRLLTPGGPKKTNKK